MRSEPVFRGYTTLLASTADKSEEDAANFVWWTRTIAQHYGPGSHFLDVTHSVPVALWFALHHFRASSSLHIFGPPGPIDLATDTVGRTEVVTYGSVDDGVLFVMDVPVVGLSEAFNHGALLDLEKAPDVFASSPRIRAQEACLIHGSVKTPGPDLSGFYACPPIRIGRPMTGCELIAQPTSSLFPEPDEDPWYAKLAGIPWSHRLDLTSGEIAVTPAIPVNLYVDQRIRREDLLSRLIVTLPMNVQATAVHEIEWCKDPPHELLKRHALADATRIILEAPVMALTPEVQSDAWNDALLMENLAATVDAYRHTGVPAGTVRLDNICIELSPLEHTGWELVERGQPLDAIRALWLVREESRLVLSYFFQEWPEPGTVTGVGCFEFIYNEAAHKIEAVSEGLESLRNEPAGRIMWKRLYTALLLCRCCSPAPHFAAVPDLVAKHANTTSIAVPWFAGPESKLIQSQTRGDFARCYVPRMTTTRSEFYTTGDPNGMVIIESSESRFSRVDPAQLHEALNRRATT